MSYKVMRVTESDYRVINKLIAEEFPYTKTSEEKLRERLANEKLKMFKLLDGKEFLGFLELEFLSGEKTRINGITIVPHYRGYGYSKKLLEFALRFCEAKNVKEVVLLVKQDNQRAKRLYEEYGFEVSGLHGKKLDDAIVEEMSLFLGQPSGVA